MIFKKLLFNIMTIKFKSFYNFTVIYEKMEKSAGQICY